MKKKPSILVFASGDKNGGGSGFQELFESTKTGILEANIVAVVSNHENGGVRKRAEMLGVPFEHCTGSGHWQYQKIYNEYNPSLVVLSGWLKKAEGLPPSETINIHPGPLPKFGGPGMYGHHVHEAVIDAFKKGEITESAVTMHFVTREYDQGPIFFQYPVLIRKDDTAETLAARVKKIEHAWQPYITNLVIRRMIRLEVNGTVSLPRFCIQNPKPGIF